MTSREAQRNSSVHECGRAGLHHKQTVNSNIFVIQNNGQKTKNVVY